MSHWSIKIGDRFFTRGGSVVTAKSQDLGTGYFLFDNGYWYSVEGREGWNVMEWPHPHDLREKVN